MATIIEQAAAAKPRKSTTTMCLSFILNGTDVARFIAAAEASGIAKGSRPVKGGNVIPGYGSFAKRIILAALTESGY